MESEESKLTKIQLKWGLQSSRSKNEKKEVIEEGRRSPSEEEPCSSRDLSWMKTIFVVSG